MFKSQLLRQTARATTVSRTLTPSIAQRSAFHIGSVLRKDDRKQPAATPLPDAPEHEGTFARTDASVQVEYPEEADLPSSTPVQGRGGLHFKRTLASFSLEGRVGVVTGGARGLGLVMSQALVISGADVALVDMNSMQLPPPFQFPFDLRMSQRRRLQSRLLSLWRASREKTQEPTSEFQSFFFFSSGKCVCQKVFEVNDLEKDTKGYRSLRRCLFSGISR